MSTHKSRSSCTAAMTFSVLNIYTINPPILGLSSLLLFLLAFPPCPTLFRSLQTSVCMLLSLCHSAFPSLIHLCHEIQFLWALPQKNTVISNPHVMPWWLTDPGTYVQLLYFFSWNILPSNFEVSKLPAIQVLLAAERPVRDSCILS